MDNWQKLIDNLGRINKDCEAIFIVVYKKINTCKNKLYSVFFY